MTQIAAAIWQEANWQLYLRDHGGDVYSSRTQWIRYWRQFGPVVGDPTA